MTRVLALLAALLLWFVATQAQAPEGAIGRYPLPGVTGTAQPCPGFVLASGTVTSSGDHELRGTPASAAIGGYTLIVPNPDLPTWHRVIEAHTQPVELVLRPVVPHTLQKVTR